MNCFICEWEANAGAMPSVSRGREAVSRPKFLTKNFESRTTPALDTRKSKIYIAKKTTREYYFLQQFTSSNNQFLLEEIMYQKKFVATILIVSFVGLGSVSSPAGATNLLVRPKPPVLVQKSTNLLANKSVPSRWSDNNLFLSRGVKRSRVFSPWLKADPDNPGIMLISAVRK